MSRSMNGFEIFVNPGDKVILECSLDQLMKYIGRKQFVDISTGEIIGKRLKKKRVSEYIA